MRARLLLLKNGGRNGIPLLVLVLVLASTPAAAQVPKPTVPSVRPVVTPIQQVCRDPAAVFLISRVVSQRRESGVLDFEGQIVNKGNAAFVSAAVQARAQILESRPNGLQPLVLVDRPLENLPPGGGVLLQFRRAFTRNQQFPPTFSLILSYDPDILHDGNPQNDDCNQSNNRIDLAGSVIDHEWPRQVIQRPR